MFLFTFLLKAILHDMHVLNYMLLKIYQLHKLYGLASLSDRFPITIEVRTSSSQKNDDISEDRR